MIDGYMASRIAKLEHEERVRSLAHIDDYDVWLTHVGGHWLSPQGGGLLSSLGKGLASLRNRLKPKWEAAPDSPLVGHEQSSVPG
jgi:hypothetical protein